jgi:dihydroorotate dehydrogenase
METAVDGVIISNTTIARPQSLYSAPELTAERGGLSGAPLRPLALKAVHDFYRLTKGNIPIIGCGGISNGPDALAFILEGASLIQLYTSMLYRGPGVVRHIKDYLTAECARRGVSNIGELVGLNHQAR